MKSGSTPPMALRILAFATAALFSTAALAAPLIWHFAGQASDGQTAFSAQLTFDPAQSSSNVITSTAVITPTQGITSTVSVSTAYYPFSELTFSLGDLEGITTTGSIAQTTSPNSAVLTDTYTVEGSFVSPQGPITSTVTATVTNTLTMAFPGLDLPGSLLTDISIFQGVTGTFGLIQTSVGPSTTSTWSINGTITSVSDLTAIPEPWTLGLMLSGLGSLGFLWFAALRSRRAR